MTPDEWEPTFSGPDGDGFCWATVKHGGSIQTLNLGPVTDRLLNGIAELLAANDYEERVALGDEA